MKKQVVIIGIAVLFICVGLSGCFGNKNKFKILSIEIEEEHIGMGLIWPYISIDFVYKGSLNISIYDSNNSIIYSDHFTSEVETQGYIYEIIHKEPDNYKLIVLDIWTSELVYEKYFETS
jgi:hypothetical protein